jgi:hypothetical protein
MQTFKITYDPKTATIEENTCRVYESDDIQKDLDKIIVYTKSDCPTPAINKAMEIIKRDNTSVLELIDHIAKRVEDVRLLTKMTREASNAVYSEHVRLLECRSMVLSDQGMMPFIKLSRFFNEADFDISGILERLDWLKKECLK